MSTGNRVTFFWKRENGFHQEAAARLYRHGGGTPQELHDFLDAIEQR